MKAAHSFKVLSCACALVLLAGCGKKNVEHETSSRFMKPEGHIMGDGSRGNDSGQMSEENIAGSDIESLDHTGSNPLLPDNTSDAYRRMYGRSTAPLYPVFFAFDSAVIRSDQFDKLNQSGDHLSKSNDPVRLEGNCDQRGTAEYNMALGELRAMSVKKYLVNLGIDSNRISTISYGSQRPLFLGTDEDSYTMNRRVDLVLPNH